MITFILSVKKVLAGSVKAFKNFPTTIGCALGFALVTMVRIQLDWPAQEPYNFLFNCLHWSFALGAILSMMLITGAQSRFNTKKAFLFANSIGALATAFTFVILYSFAGTDPGYVGARYQVVSSLAVARVSMAMLVSYLVFVVLSGLPFEEAIMDENKNKDTNKSNPGILHIDFSKAFFMSHKAFFIALIYGVIILGGSMGVARAVQALLYQNMSNKVYMYIGTITGLMAFTLYVGYFPDFRKSEKDEHREVAEKQPRFIEVLFGYIMVPLMIALSIVLLLWAGRTVFSGMNAPIVRLAGIAASYTILGIWLHMMVSGHPTGMAKFYRRFYPIAALVILVFEIWALVNQLNKTGLKLTEYWFILVWIIAAVGAVLLILLKSRSYVFIVAMTCILAVISVSPFVGYNVLPVNAQVNRLEALLVSENMLENDKIVSAEVEPSLTVRESITDAVTYLVSVNDAKLPSWFDKNLVSNNTFRKTFGFDKVWPKDDFGPYPSDFMGINLHLPAVPVDISGYNWAINVQNPFEKDQGFIPFEGLLGSYRVYWQHETGSNLPSLEIQLNSETILEKDMNEFIDQILAKYPPGNIQSIEATLEDMTMVLESEEIKVLLLFRSLYVNIDPQNDHIYYGIELETLYMLEKNL